MSMIGYLRLSDKITPELALETIESIHVLGISRPAMKSRRRWRIAFNSGGLD